MQDLVFALIIAKNQLVTLVRMKKYYLHPMDLHLIINLVNASESFKEAESWTPICLPKFDARLVKGSALCTPGLDLLSCTRSRHEHLIVPLSTALHYCVFHPNICKLFHSTPLKICFDLFSEHWLSALFQNFKRIFFFSPQVLLLDCV